MESPVRAVSSTGVVVAPSTGRLMVKFVESSTAFTTAAAGMLGPNTGMPMESEEVSWQLMVVEPMEKFRVTAVSWSEADPWLM